MLSRTFLHLKVYLLSLSGSSIRIFIENSKANVVISEIALIRTKRWL